MITISNRERTRDRLLRLQSRPAVSGVRQARGLRVFRRRAPGLTGGRLRTGGVNTRFLSPVSFDSSDFSIRRGLAESESEGVPKITFPTAGVARIHEPEGLRLRRPVA